MSQNAELDEFFRRRGVPHLAHGFDAREDVLSRMVPALLVVFVVLLAVSLAPTVDTLWRVAGTLGGAALAGGLLMGLSRLRGHGWSVRPRRVGFPEAAVLVATPAAVDLVMGDDVTGSAWLLLLALMVALTLYAATSLGAVTALMYPGRSTVEAVRDTAVVASRAMPPVLVVLLFLFLAQEVWQTLGVIEGWRFTGVFTAFAILGVLVLLAGLRAQRHQLCNPVDDDELRARALSTPAAARVHAGVRPAVHGMTRRQRVNVTVTLVTALGVRVVLVGASVGMFFLVFGLLVMQRPVVESWTGLKGDDLHVFFEYNGRQGNVLLSEAMVRVSVLLGAFAALYFAVVSVGDDRNRREFIDDEIDRLRDAVAAWAYDRGAARDGGAD